MIWESPSVTLWPPKPYQMFAEYYPMLGNEMTIKHGKVASLTLPIIIKLPFSELRNSKLDC
jgi:hypothetical protein